VFFNPISDIGSVEEVHVASQGPVIEEQLIAEACMDSLRSEQRSEVREAVSVHRRMQWDIMRVKCRHTNLRISSSKT